METETRDIRSRAPAAYGQYANLTSDQKREVARARIQKYIDDGKRTAPAAIQTILSETPVDRIVRSQAIDVVANEAGVFEMRIPSVTDPIGTFSDHALEQLASRVDYSGREITKLRSTEWGRRLIATNLNEYGAHRPENEKLLVREVNGRVRGVLSNGFRPEDSRPAVDSLIGVVRDAGGLITSATALDNRISIKAILAEPIEVFPGEWAVFGFDFRTGDYGGVARELMGWILRCACLNGVCTTENYRRVHLGARIHDEVEYSNKTRKLNDALTVSQMRDMGRALLGREAVEKKVAAIRAANETELDPEKAVASLRKRVTKAEEKAIVEKFNSPDVELLPPGQTTWRWSNAISWLATQTEDPSRRLDLEKLGGEVMEQPKAA